MSLQHSVSLQKPQHPSCQGRAGTHLRNFQGKLDFSFQSHLGCGTSNLSLQFFLFFNCCFVLVSAPCHCPLRSVLDGLTEHYLHITHNSPNGSDLFHCFSEHIWRLGFWGFFVGGEWRCPYTAEKIGFPPQCELTVELTLGCSASSQTVIFKYSRSYQGMYNITCLGSLSFVYSEKLLVLKSLHQSLYLFLSHNLEVNLHS